MWALQIKKLFDNNCKDTLFRYKINKSGPSSELFNS